MAKHQHLSRYQQGIVKRYYAHADTITLTKLAELVSDLAVAESPSATAKLWTKAEAALAKAGVEPAKAAKVIATRDLKALAALVGELSGR